MNTNNEEIEKFLNVISDYKQLGKSALIAQLLQKASGYPDDTYIGCDGTLFNQLKNLDQYYRVPEKRRCRYEYWRFSKCPNENCRLSKKTAVDMLRRIDEGGKNSYEGVNIPIADGNAPEECSAAPQIPAESEEKQEDPAAASFNSLVPAGLSDSSVKVHAGPEMKPDVPHREARENALRRCEQLNAEVLENEQKATAMQKDMVTSIRSMLKETSGFCENAEAFVQQEADMATTVGIIANQIRNLGEAINGAKKTIESAQKVIIEAEEQMIALESSLNRTAGNVQELKREVSISNSKIASFEQKEDRLEDFNSSFCQFMNEWKNSLYQKRNQKLVNLYPRLVKLASSCGLKEFQMDFEAAIAEQGLAVFEPQPGDLYNSRYHVCNEDHPEGRTVRSCVCPGIKMITTEYPEGRVLLEAEVTLMAGENHDYTV